MLRIVVMGECLLKNKCFKDANLCNNDILMQTSKLLSLSSPFSQFSKPNSKSKKSEGAGMVSSQNLWDPSLRSKDQGVRSGVLLIH